ncbi:hypothetical protein ACQ4PT_017208 [Festuca glaucescens]
MDDGNNNICVFPTATDVLADILVRLPPNARRRLRLVCQLWRDIVDERAAADMRSRAKIVAVTTEGAAYVVDVLSPGSHTNLCSVAAPAGDESVRRSDERGGHLPWPRLPVRGPGARRSHHACQPGDRRGAPPSAAAHAERVRPAVPEKQQELAPDLHLRVPPDHGAVQGRARPVCCFDPFWEPGAVHVFTLGEASWRDVQLAGPDARCSLGRSSLVDVDGMVYWMTEFTGSVMAFSLEDERVTRTAPLPVPARPSTCRLTKVHARLGVAVSGDESLTVWVLEGDSWSRRYVLGAHKLRKQELVVPHFAHGDYVLTHGRSGETAVLYRHKMSGAARLQGGGGVVQIERKDRGESVTCLVQSIYRTFAYTETKESLSVYSAALMTRCGSAVS